MKTGHRSWRALRRHVFTPYRSRRSLNPRSGPGAPAPFTRMRYFFLSAASSSAGFRCFFGFAAAGAAGGRGEEDESQAKRAGCQSDAGRGISRAQVGGEWG